MNGNYAKLLAVDIIKTAWANDIAQPPKLRSLKRWNQITEKKCGEVASAEIEEIIQVLEASLIYPKFEK